MTDDIPPPPPFAEHEETSATSPHPHARREDDILAAGNGEDQNHENLRGISRIELIKRGWATALALSQYATLAPPLLWSFRYLTPLLLSLGGQIWSYRDKIWHGSAVLSKSLSTEPYVYGPLANDQQRALEYLLQQHHWTTVQLSLVEVVLAILWSLISLIPLHNLVTLLTARWLTYYSPAAVLIRILTCSTLLFYVLGFFFKFVDFRCTEPGSPAPRSAGVLSSLTAPSAPPSSASSTLSVLEVVFSEVLHRRRIDCLETDRKPPLLLLMWIILSITVTFFRDLVVQMSSSVQETRKANMMNNNNGANQDSNGQDVVERGSSRAASFSTALADHRSRANSTSTFTTSDRNHTSRSRSRASIRSRAGSATKSSTARRDISKRVISAAVTERPLMISLERLGYLSLGTLSVLLLAKILL